MMEVCRYCNRKMMAGSLYVKSSRAAILYFESKRKYPDIMKRIKKHLRVNLIETRWYRSRDVNLTWTDNDRYLLEQQKEQDASPGNRTWLCPNCNRVFAEIRISSSQQKKYEFLKG